MSEIDTAVANCIRATEELENEARKMAADSRAELSLYDSRLLRDRISECGSRAARAERSVLEVPISFGAK